MRNIKLKIESILEKEYRIKSEKKSNLLINK